MIRILCVHCAGPFGGSSRSLYEMLSAMPEDEVDLYFLTQAGGVESYFERLGKVFSVRGLPQFDHGRYSYYRGVRWLVLLRELIYIPFAFFGIFRVWRNVKDIELIHVNDYVGIFTGVLLKYLCKAKLICHVRCLVCTDKNLLRTRLINSLIARYADAVICIDENVRRTISPEIDAEVIHNGMNVDFRKIYVEEIGVNKFEPLRVGFVGNLLAQKGVVDLINAAALLKKRDEKVVFHIFGDSAKSHGGLKGLILKLFGLRQDVNQELIEIVEREGLEDIVEFHGFVSDLQAAYTKMDIVCFPSHLDAPGRPVIEAAYFSRPSIVAVENPTPDTLVPGETGVKVAAKSPGQLADVISSFSENRARLVEMGGKAKMLADKFYNQKENSLKVLSIYKKLSMKR